MATAAHLLPVVSVCVSECVLHTAHCSNMPTAHVVYHSTWAVNFDLCVCVMTPALMDRSCGVLRNAAENDHSYDNKAERKYSPSITTTPCYTFEN